MYLAFDEYQNLGGNLDEAIFFRFEMQASQKLNYFTDRRLVNDDEFPAEVKLVMFQLIGEFKKKSDYENPNSEIVSGFSNDGVSISYAKQTAQEFLDGFDKNVYRIIKEGLYGVKNQSGQSLIYRGLI